MDPHADAAALAASNEYYRATGDPEGAELTYRRVYNAHVRELRGEAFLPAESDENLD